MIKEKNVLIFELLANECWVSLDLFNIKCGKYLISSYGNIRDIELSTSCNPVYHSENGYDYMLLMTCDNKFKMFNFDELMYLSFLYQYDGDKLTHKPDLDIADDDNITWYNIIHLDGNNRNNSIDNLSLQKIDEIWDDITYSKEIIPRKYTISNFGRIKNIKNKINKHMIDKQGYHIAHLCIGNHSYIHYLVHRLVAISFIYNCDSLNKNQVNHIDGDKSNNSYRNLEWVTQSDNIQHGRKTSIWDTKLSIDDVKLISELLIKYDGAPVMVFRELNGIINNITIDDINNIKNGSCYKYISEEYLKDNKFVNLRKKLSDEQVHLICKTLLELNGSQYNVLNKLKDIIPNLQSDDIRRIKTKTNYKNISDMYFKEDIFPKRIHKLPEETVKIICECLVETQGIVKKCCYLLHQRSIVIDKSTVYDIKTKITYREISDMYFDDMYFSQFHHKVDSNDIERTCECLVNTHGNCTLTYNILHNDIPYLSNRQVINIRNKHNWREISDKYFTYNNGEFKVLTK